MASSPFRVFRKHQKAIFAGLTILCMVTFVMCAGIGQGSNIFESFGVMFGAGRRSEVVATMYGKDVFAREIQDLRNQRKLANQYMDSVTARAREETIQSIKEATNKWNDSQGQLIQQIIQMWESSFRSRQQRFQYLQTAPQIVQFLAGQRAKLLESKKTTEAKLIEDLSISLEKDYGQSFRPPNQLYFGASTSLDDILDFMIWRHEADRRGIQLNAQDINNLVYIETDNKGISKNALSNIEEGLRRNRDFSPELLRAALADEFRVRIAKTALMGDDRYDPRTTWATPYEFWQYYKDNRTENVVAVLPIPVRNKEFLAQVGQPAEKDLKDLFEKHKDLEYQAGSELPGFKVPSKIEVEWVSAKADSKQYRGQAERAAGLIQAGFQVMAGGGQTMSGIVAADAFAAAYPFALEQTLKVGVDTSLLDQYEREKWRMYKPSWTSTWNYRLHDTSIDRADNVAAALGQAGGSMGTQAPVISSLMTYHGSAALHEVFDRARIGTTIVGLAGSDPTPFSPVALVFHGTPQSPYIPLSAVKDELTKTLHEELVKKLVQTDLDDLRKKLTENRGETPEQELILRSFYRPEVMMSTLGTTMGSAGTGAPIALVTPTMIGPPVIKYYYQTLAHQGLATALAGANPYPLLARGVDPLLKNRKVIDEAVARHGFQHGRTRKPEDRFTIGDDEGLKPMKDAYLHNPFGDAKGKKFGEMFFRYRGDYSPEEYPLGGSRLGQGPSFLHWQTNDKPAYVPTFDEVKDKVKDWWQMEKARDVAKKEAEELKAKAQGQTDAQRWLKDGTKHSEPMFLLDGVAGLVKPLTPRAGRDEYQPYQIPSEKIEYPPEGLDKDLLKLTEPGQVLVKSDRPKEHYYVFALVKRTQPSEFAFYREYKSGPEGLLGLLERETNYRDEFQKGLLNQLRQEAHLRINEENREKVDEKSRSDDS